MSYSKSRVDRAGRTVADQMRAAREHQLVVGIPEFREAIEIIDRWRSEHAKPLSRVASNLRYYAAKEGRPVVAQRLKRAPTIADKLLREPSMKLSRMGDIGGVRAVLPSQESVYRVAAHLRRNWTITRFRDYVSSPKPDGYRALHLINRHRGRLIEVQLRTPDQDYWANVVEVFSRTIAPRLKYGDGPPELQEYLVLSAEVFACGDQDRPISSDLAARVRDSQRRAATFVREAADES